MENGTDSAPRIFQTRWLLDSDSPVILTARSLVLRLEHYIANGTASVENGVAGMRWTFADEKNGDVVAFELLVNDRGLSLDASLDLGNNGGRVRLLARWTVFGMRSGKPESEVEMVVSNLSHKPPALVARYARALVAWSEYAARMEGDLHDLDAAMRRLPEAQVQVVASEAQRTWQAGYEELQS